MRSRLSDFDGDCADGTLGRPIDAVQSIDTSPLADTDRSVDTGEDGAGWTRWDPVRNRALLDVVFEALAGEEDVEVPDPIRTRLVGYPEVLTCAPPTGPGP